MTKGVVVLLPCFLLPEPREKEVFQTIKLLLLFLFSAGNKDQLQYLKHLDN